MNHTLLVPPTKAPSFGNLLPSTWSPKASLSGPESHPSQNYEAFGTYPSMSHRTGQESSYRQFVSPSSVNLVQTPANNTDIPQPSTSYPRSFLHGARSKKSTPTSMSIEEPPLTDSRSTTTSRASMFKRVWGAILIWASLKPPRRRAERVLPNQDGRLHQVTSRIHHRPNVHGPAVRVSPTKQQGISEKALGKRREEEEPPHDSALSEPEIVCESVTVDSKRPAESGSNPNDVVSPKASLAEVHGTSSTVRDMSLTVGRNDRLLEQHHRPISDLLRLMLEHQATDLSGEVTVDKKARERPIRGGQSLVYLGILGDRLVAVKIPMPVRQIQKHDPNWEVDTKRRSRREVDFLAAVSHPNINVFYGYSNDFCMFGPFPAMISMWCHYGTILDYLDAEKPPVLQRVQLAHGLSHGVHHLHQLHLIHGDIKPTNVLVDDERVARLCDLGCAQPVAGCGLDDMVTAAPYMGTERYKARELFISPENPHPIPTREGDIYSLGCVIVETIEHPVYAFEHVPKRALQSEILNGEPPASRSQSTCGLPAESRDILWNLLEGCWDAASSRPSIRQVVGVLGVVESECAT